MPPLIDLTGTRFGRLVVAGRAPSAYTSAGIQRTRWLARCDCGGWVTVRGGQLQQGRTRSCGCLKHERDVQWGLGNRQEAVSYQGAHSRLLRERGRARAHACVDCGAAARDWSYQGFCDEQRVGANGVPFCLHGDHYAPRCKVCHFAHDRERLPNGQFAPRPDGASS